VSLRRVLDEIRRLSTERKEYDLSSLSPDEIYTLSVEENVNALLKLREVKGEVLNLARWWADTLRSGGRIILIGAGTSKVGSGDLVIGLSASGRTPYVRAALERAMERGSRTAVITTNPCNVISIKAHLRVCVPVGPEILPGSTRMKSATVQKVILNTVSLIGAVLLGKVERGRMVDMVPTSGKLRARAVKTLVEEFNLREEEAEGILRE